MPITLERIPHDKQVAIQALLFTGHTYRKIAKALDVSQNVVARVKSELPSNSSEVEQFKKDLINRSYSISQRSMFRISDEKLNACSAPQLAMVSGIFIDKARDMEGSNRPVFNIVTMAATITRNISELKQKQQALLALEAEQTSVVS